ncbi:hypothetical protein D3C84_960200 [compost metagenome]
MQHHAVIAHRPALLRGGEVHGIEVGTDRDTGLGPAGALIVGIQDMAALAHGNQALTGLGQVEQGAAYRQFAALRRQVEHIDQGHGLGITHHQGHAQGNELEGKHGTSSEKESGCRSPHSKGAATNLAQRMPAPARDSAAH